MHNIIATVSKQMQYANCGGELLRSSILAEPASALGPSSQTCALHCGTAKRRNNNACKPGLNLCFTSTHDIPSIIGTTVRILWLGQAKAWQNLPMHASYAHA